MKLDLYTRLGFPPGSQPCLATAPCLLSLPSLPCESTPGFHHWPGEPPHYAPEPDLVERLWPWSGTEKEQRDTAGLGS